MPVVKVQTSSAHRFATSRSTRRPRRGRSKPTDGNYYHNTLAPARNIFAVPVSRPDEMSL